MSCISTKKSVLWIAWFITFLLFLMVGTYRGWAAWIDWPAVGDKYHQVISVNNIQYNSNVDFAPKSLSIDTSPSYTDLVTINLRFKIKDLNRLMDLFQTGSSNSGIRVEIEPSGLIDVIVGSNNTQGFSSLQFIPTIKANEWHSLEIVVNGRMVKGILDNKIILSTMDNSLKYAFSDIKIGSGFSADRNFNGEITNFGITNGILDKDYHHKLNIIQQSIMLALSILMLSIFVLLAQQKMDRLFKIEFLSLAIMLGFVIAVIFHYILAYYWGSSSPRNTFLLYIFGGQFGDLNISLFQDQFFAPYDISLGPNRAQYFPFSYVLIYPLAKLSQELAIFAYSLLFIFSMILYSYTYFSSTYFSSTYFSSTYFSSPDLSKMGSKLANFKNIFIIGILSYPFLFAIERGNLENLLFILIALSLYLYSKQRRILSVLFLAMASAMKLYPLFFVLYFISEKKYAEFFLTIIFFVILTVGSLFILKPGFEQNLINWHAALTSMGKNILYLPDSCVRFNLGLWGLIKTIYSHYHLSIRLEKISILYHIFVAVMLAAVMSCIVFIEKTPWKKLALIVLSILLFPEMSNDYKLLLIYIPLAAFVNSDSKKSDMLYAIFFVILMIPKNYYWIKNDISISTIINPIVIFSMMLIILVSGIIDKYRLRQRMLFSKK